MRSRSSAVCEGSVSFEYLSGLALAAALLVYLVYALVRPERF